MNKKFKRQDQGGGVAILSTQPLCSQSHFIQNNNGAAALLNRELHHSSVADYLMKKVCFKVIYSHLICTVVPTICSLIMIHVQQFWWACTWPFKFCSFSFSFKFCFWSMDCSPWGSKNRIGSKNSCK